MKNKTCYPTLEIWPTEMKNANHLPLKTIEMRGEMHCIHIPFYHYILPSFGCIYEFLSRDVYQIKVSSQHEKYFFPHSKDTYILTSLSPQN